MNIRELTKEEIAEESLIDLSYAILEEKKEAISFFDLLEEIKKLKEYSEEEANEIIVQFFTDLNIDGRFLLNNENKWGLREWYKIETVEEETAPTVKARKRRAKLGFDDEEEILIDEDDLVFEEEFEEFIEEDDDGDFDNDIDDEFDDEIDDLDADIDEDLDGVDEELIEEDEEFLIDDDELEIEEEEADEEE